MKIQVTQEVENLIKKFIAKDHCNKGDEVSIRDINEYYIGDETEGVPSHKRKVTFLRVSVNGGPYRKYNLPIGVLDHFKGLHDIGLENQPEEAEITNLKIVISREKSDIKKMIVTELLHVEGWINEERKFLVTDLLGHPERIAKITRFSIEFINELSDILDGGLPT